MVELTNTQSTIRRSLQNLVGDSLEQQQQLILRTESSIDTTTSGTELDLGSETYQQQQQQQRIEAQNNYNKHQELANKVIEHNRLPNKSEEDQHNLSIFDDSGTTLASNPTNYYSTTTTTTGQLFLSTSSSTNYLSDTTASETQKSFSVRDLNETELDFELFNSSLNDLTSESKQSETAEKISTPAVVTSSSASENIVVLSSRQEHIGTADAITRSSSPATAAAAPTDQHQSLHNQKDHEKFLLSSSAGEPKSEITSNKLGYQLRALNENISAWETNPWFRAPTLPPNNINVSPLSTELVNETLNYFVNCGQRLSQMTKTYDDNDAYILLLQEKEVDLELAARIGQDLLRQNKELKESIKSLEDELSKRQGDVQQLKHELASKISLLDTFIEEEEQNQTSLAENEDDSTLRQHDLINNNRPSTSNSQQPKYLSSLPATPDNNNDDEGPSGFLSLNFNYPKPDNSFVEPFSSLPPYPLSDQSQQQHHNHHHHHNNHQQVLHGNDSSSTISEDLNSSSKAQEQQKLVQSVTFQLVESNKRLCELQDELFYKSEQNLMQQEKIFNLQEQLKETDRRLGDVAAENELLQKSIMESTESQKELSDELKVCKRNFSDLLSVFLELQKESRIFRNSTMLQNSNLNYIGEIDPVNDMNNISFDSFKRKSFNDDDDQQVTETNHATTNTYATTKNNNTTTTPITTDSLDQMNEISSKTNNNVYTQGRIRHDNTNNKNKANSLSLLDELQETMQRTGLGGVRVSMTTSSGSEDDCDSDGQGDATDGGDSGVHTNINASSSTTPSADALADHDDSCEDSGPLTKQHPGDNSNNNGNNNNNNNKTWLGFSSFMLTTLLLLCLSVTFTSSPNFPLTPKLKIKLDR